MSQPPPPAAKDPAPPADATATERRLKWVIQRALALCLGAMGAFIACVRQVNPEIDFRFDWITLAGALFGGWMGWIFWGVIPRDGPGARPGKTRWLPLVLWLGVLTAGMLFGFGYGMKGLSGPKQREMLTGTALATLVLGLFGFLIWKVGHFFEHDSRRYLEDHPEYEKRDD